MNKKSSRLYFATLFISVIGIVAYGCTGCMTVNPEKFEKAYKSWVPIGTSSEDAERIMRKRGFECKKTRFETENRWAGPILSCKRHNVFLNRTWIVNLFLKDDKVVGYHDQLFTDFWRAAPTS